MHPERAAGTTVACRTTCAQCHDVIAASRANSKLCVRCLLRRGSSTATVVAGTDGGALQDLITLTHIVLGLVLEDEDGQQQEQTAGGQLGFSSHFPR